MPRLEHRASYRLSKPWPLSLRWGLLAAVPIIELIGLSVCFDTLVLSKRDSEWTHLAGEAPALLRLVLAFLAAFLLILAPRIQALVGEARQFALSHLWWRWLLIHLLIFLAFCEVTTLLFDLAAAGAEIPGILIAGWAGLGLASFGLWLEVMLPMGFWVRLFSREGLALLAAMLAGLAAWLGGLFAQELWRPLTAGTFWLSYRLLSLGYRDVVHDSETHILGTPNFLVDIAPSCSGYEGIGLVTVFLVIYLWLFRAEIRFPQAFLLFPIGALAVWLANSVRIALLIAIGTSFSPKVAMGGFHSQAGWIAFIAVALGLILAMRRLRIFMKATSRGVLVEESNAAAPLLVPWLVLMGVLVLTSALSDGEFDWLYPWRIIAAAAVLWHFRGVYRGWDWSFGWQGAVMGAAVFAIWIVLEPSMNGGAKSVLETALAALPAGQKALWLAFRVAGSIIIIPWVEELAFRGYLLRRLAGQHFDTLAPPRFTWGSFILSSLAFGLLHTRWLAGTLAGMIYALAFYRRGKLGDAITAHMVSNGLIALSVLAGDRWSFWS